MLREFLLVWMEKSATCFCCCLRRFAFRRSTFMRVHGVHHGEPGFSVSRKFLVKQYDTVKSRTVPVTVKNCQ